ncbi:MAG: glycosyltransferase family 39 protein, partial [Anaerolineae bacterium]|nr:glycosyltransferase family 39 protein [Thermoflexales bacterium]MDW8408695.1 glycosyltransferase family 39 protein [Anaerolineae bacterium]
LNHSVLRYALGLSVVLITAFALRMYQLGTQSFWYDEGNSARIAERSVQLIIEGAAGDIHPPLYYIALHGWRALFGESEAALRSLSAICSTALALVAGLSGRMLFGARAGLLAAALVALSPFAVYYGQEARMYALLALEAAVSTHALLVVLNLPSQPLDSRSPSRTFPLGLFVLATAAGLYTHYAYPFVMIAQGLLVVTVWVVRLATRVSLEHIWPMWVRYAGATLAAIALFLPWLPTALHQVTSWTVVRPQYELGPAILDAWRWILVGRTLPLEAAAPAMLVLSAFALIGLLTPLSSGHRLPLIDRLLPALSMGIQVVIPLVLLFALNLYREAYLKFLLVAVTPLCVLAGHGIASLSSIPLPVSRTARRLLSWGISLGWLGGAAILLWPALDNLYHNPAYARDDYRAIAQLVQADARPGDAVLFNAPNQWEVFTYYHRPERALAPAIPLAYHPDDRAVDVQMNSILERHERLFVLYYGERESDPEGRYERWLAHQAFKADERWIGHIRLAVYAAHLRASDQISAAIFGDAIQLEGGRIDRTAYRSTGLIPLELRWRALRPLSARYKVFVHVGALDAPPAAQSDGEPVGGLFPTDAWQTGQPIVDRRAVWLSHELPAGRYGIYLGLYDGATGQRLPITVPDESASGDRLWLGEIEIK